MAVDFSFTQGAHQTYSRRSAAIRMERPRTS